MGECWRLIVISLDMTHLDMTHFDMTHLLSHMSQIYCILLYMTHMSHTDSY
jgi:hypothetical protein